MLARFRLRKNLIIIVSAILLSAAAVFVNPESAKALNVSPSLVTNVSPSVYQTTQVTGNEQPWHNLILSDHGRVQSIEVGMYFPTPTGRSFHINVSGVCDMVAPPSGYPLTSPYLYIEMGNSPQNFGTNAYEPGDTKIAVTANQACYNGWLDLREFSIPASVLPLDPTGTGLYRAKITMRWVEPTDPGAPSGIRSTLAAQDSGNGSRIRFRFDASAGGKVGYLDTSGASTTVTNNSTVHSAVNEYEPIFYPFGLPCNAGAAATREVVSVYDADNGSASQYRANTLYFYVATIDLATNTVRPLRMSEYTNLALNGPATSLGDIWVNEEPTGSNRTDVTRTLRAYDTADSPGGYNYPIFTPSNFDNNGGKTSVRVHTVRQNTKYVLVVRHIHANQFVYIGVPGDAIFGSPDTTCPAALSPNVGLGGVFEEGSNVTAAASVINSLPSAGTADWLREFWYENSDDIDPSPGGPGDVPISTIPPGNDQIFNQGPTPTTPNNPPFLYLTETIEPGKRRICTKLTLYNPWPGTTLSSPPYDVHCEYIVSKPYLHVYSGDVQAGAVFEGFGTGCSATPNHGFIKTYNQGNPGEPTAGGPFAGAGTHIAAFAYAAIDEFISGSFHAVGPSGKPKGLSFANTSTDTYGGDSGMKTCITDYWNYSTPAGSKTLSDIKAVVNVAPYVLPSYVIPAGTPQPTIFVNGSLHINRNVLFSTAWGDIKNAPVQWFVVKGNITIDPNVQQLAGVYIALPKDDGTEGKIFTCSPTAYSAPAASDMRIGEPCDSYNLRVDGAFIARQIKFTRTKGTTSAAKVGEGLPIAPQAETFLFNPLVWINLPSDINTGDNDPYDSILNLPPVL